MVRSSTRSNGIAFHIFTFEISTTIPSFLFDLLHHLLKRMDAIPLILPSNISDGKYLFLSFLKEEEELLSKNWNYSIVL